MKPEGLSTKIFLDSGDPQETREALQLLGFLDGQTTNPSLIAKNPQAKARLESGDKFSEREVWDFYREVVSEISGLIPDGSVSVEVYADADTPAEYMLAQGKKFFQWIPNAHIKFPCTYEGLKAAQSAVKEGMRVNMTLCFTQEQAAAVHAATLGAKRGDVFVSPFIGRLDDRGENGMDLIVNILHMYQRFESHVEVLAASARNLRHFMYSLKLGSDIITVPLSVLKEWVASGMKLPGEEYEYDAGNLAPIPYRELQPDRPIPAYNVTVINDLTKAGLEKFTADWKALISK